MARVAAAAEIATVTRDEDRGARVDPPGAARARAFTTRSRGGAREKRSERRFRRGRRVGWVRNSRRLCWRRRRASSSFDRAHATLIASFVEAHGAACLPGGDARALAARCLETSRSSKTTDAGFEPATGGGDGVGGVIARARLRRGTRRSTRSRRRAKTPPSEDARSPPSSKNSRTRSTNGALTNEAPIGSWRLDGVALAVGPAALVDAVFGERRPDERRRERRDSHPRHRRVPRVLVRRWRASLPGRRRDRHAKTRGGGGGGDNGDGRSRRVSPGGRRRVGIIGVAAALGPGGARSVARTRRRRVRRAPLRARRSRGDADGEGTAARLWTRTFRTRTFRTRTRTRIRPQTFRTRTFRIRNRSWKMRRRLHVRVAIHVAGDASWVRIARDGGVPRAPPSASASRSKDVLLRRARGAVLPTR